MCIRDRLKEEQKLSNNQRQYGGVTLIDVSQSDIRAAARAELKSLYQLVNRKRKTASGMGKAHLEDAKSSIAQLLDLDD